MKDLQLIWLNIRLIFFVLIFFLYSCSGSTYLIFPALENMGIVAVGSRIAFLAIFFPVEMETAILNSKWSSDITNRNSEGNLQVVKNL